MKYTRAYGITTSHYTPLDLEKAVAAVALMKETKTHTEAPDEYVEDSTLHAWRAEKESKDVCAAVRALIGDCYDAILYTNAELQNETFEDF